jgi:hypothetical protein
MPSYFHDGTADQSRLTQHQIHQVLIVEPGRIQSQRLKTRGFKTEHVGGRFPLQQFLDFIAGERLFEIIPFVDFHLFLQKKLFRFPAGSSFAPAVKIGLHFNLSLSIPHRIYDL